MSRSDPGAATGQIPYEPTRCTCTHLVTLHAINTKGQRSACTKSGPRACGCRVFVKAVS